jgi:hypothetical protein
MTHRAFAGSLVLLAAVPATAAAQGPAIATDLPCYIEQQPMAISGNGFGAGTSWTVKTEQLFDFGTVGADGTFLSTNETAPIVPTITPESREFRLVGTQDGAEVASTTFRVANFAVSISPSRGRPTSAARWRFSGFQPGKNIYLHVRRGSKTLRNFSFGKAQGACGELSKRAKRLPIPARSIKRGSYGFFIDSSPRFSAKTRPQYRITTTVTTTFRRP